MQDLIVIGHLNPDTDSACAAIAFAWYKTQTGTPATAYISGPLNKEASFVLGHFGIATPSIREKLGEDDRVALVDTNNPEEIIAGIADAELVEIVDHHRLTGGLSTPGPIAVTIRPVACTTTLIYDLVQKAGLTLPKDIAGIMLSALLSDTLKFTSPTTTPEDKAVAEALAVLAEVNIDEVADAMFSAKSDLTGMSPADLLMADSKIFTLAGKKIRLSVLETTKPENALAMKESIIEAAQSMKQAEELDGVFFYIVDIINSNAELLLPGTFEQEVAERAYDVTIDGSSVNLPGVVSRKKQMVPNIEAALTA